MKAIIKLELYDDSTNMSIHDLIKYIDSIRGKGTGRIILGSIPPSVWVAEIIGRDPKYQYARKFLRYKKDYSQSNSKGTRGIYAVYIIDEGRIYEVKDNKKRYFCIVQDWDIRQVNLDYVESWLRSKNE
jgi:hypothetical protein